jgi:hypothetical protein
LDGGLFDDFIASMFQLELGYGWYFASSSAGFIVAVVDRSGWTVKFNQTI